MIKKPTTTKIRVYTTPSKRVSISVPWNDARQVNAVRSHILHLIEVKRESIPIQRQTNEWLKTLPDKLRQRLAEMGLIQESSGDQWPNKICEFMYKYVQSRVDWKKPENYQQPVNKLLEFLGGKDRLFGNLSVGEGEDFHRWMQRGGGLSPNTAGQHIKRCKQMWKAAIDYGVADFNPFANIKINLRSDPTKNVDVTQAMFEKLLKACPTPEWRSIIALARIAGARCPSEIVGLHWSHIDWDKKTLVLKSPKTAGSGKPERTIPLFAKLEQELLALRKSHVQNDHQLSGVKVIPMVVCGSQNLRKGLNSIIRKAGLTPWPKPFMALRRSARNELEHAGEFTEFQLERWFGHTPKVAKKYYLDNDDASMKKAARYGSQERCLKKCPSEAFPRMQGVLQKLIKPVNIDIFLQEMARVKAQEYTYLGSNQKPSVP